MASNEDFFLENREKNEEKERQKETKINKNKGKMGPKNLRKRAKSEENKEK